MWLLRERMRSSVVPKSWAGKQDGADVNARRETDHENKAAICSGFARMNYFCEQLFIAKHRFESRNTYKKS